MYARGDMAGAYVAFQELARRSPDMSEHVEKIFAQYKPTPTPPQLTHTQLEQLSDADLNQHSQIAGTAHDRAQSDLAGAEMARRLWQERQAFAEKLARSLLCLPRQHALRQADFVLRCDEDCALVMVVPRTKLAHPDSFPESLLMICFTARDHYEATLLDWRIKVGGGLEKDRWLPVACRHGRGQLIKNNVATLSFSMSAPDHHLNAWPEDLPLPDLERVAGLAPAPHGATRRLSDPTGDAERPSFGVWLLRDTWRAKASPQQR